MEENNNLGEFSNFMLYSSGESKVSVQVFIDKMHNTIWATQKSMAQLFDVGVPAISKHLKNIYEEGELTKDTTISKMETVVNRGFRGDVKEKVDFYNLDAIISVQYISILHQKLLKSVQIQPNHTWGLQIGNIKRQVERFINLMLS